MKRLMLYLIAKWNAKITRLNAAANIILQKQFFFLSLPRKEEEDYYSEFFFLNWIVSNQIYFWFFEIRLFCCRQSKASGVSVLFEHTLTKFEAQPKLLFIFIFWNGPSRPLFLYFCLFCMTQFKYIMMVSLGLEPRVADWKA